MKRMKDISLLISADHLAVNMLYIAGVLNV